MNAPTPPDLDNELSMSTVDRPNSQIEDMVKAMMDTTMAMAEERREDKKLSQLAEERHWGRKAERKAEKEEKKRLEGTSQMMMRSVVGKAWRGRRDAETMKRRDIKDDERCRGEEEVRCLRDEERDKRRAAKDAP